LGFILLLLVFALPGRAWAHHFGPGSGRWSLWVLLLFLLAFAVIWIWSTRTETRQRKAKEERQE